MKNKIKLKIKLKRNNLFRLHSILNAVDTSYIDFDEIEYLDKLQKKIELITNKIILEEFKNEY
jgi:hypothetical protein